MTHRPLDDDGDMMPVRAADEMLSGADAVGQAVASRLRLVYGEWWEDRTVGFRAPRILTEGVRTEDGREMLANYIGAYIKDTDGVRAIAGTRVRYGGHELSVDAAIETESGEIIERTVSADVIYGAVS